MIIVNSRWKECASTSRARTSKNVPDDRERMNLLVNRSLPSRSPKYTGKESTLTSDVRGNAVHPVIGPILVL